VQSADSPTAGATADSATVVAALLQQGRGLRAYATVVDVPAVAACFAAGVDGTVDTGVGATLDPRWSEPVRLTGTVRRLGADPVVLTGASMTGQPISMGRWATVDTGSGLTVLLTERAAPTFDPAGYRHVGLEPAGADAVLVRSATMYRAGFRGLYAEAILLDLPGASTPRLDYLEFARAPRPLYPIDGAT
jgi:microcystin degradation protein MlrC